MPSFGNATNKKTANKKIKSYKYGIIAEIIASIFLRLKGYKILKRRYKTFVGEIDIIAKKKNSLIVVEVKARKNITVKNGFLIDEVIGEAQQKRIRRAMDVFIKNHQRKYQNYNIRFDLIVISPFKMPLHLIGFL